MKIDATTLRTTSTIAASMAASARKGETEIISRLTLKPDVTVAQLARLLRRFPNRIGAPTVSVERRQGGGLCLQVRVPTRGWRPADS